MKISLRFLGLNAPATWNHLVMEHLKLLDKLANIESAQVDLERQREGKHTFRARVVLAVPGPDFHAEAADQTLRAALSKVVEKLEHQIRVRHNKRVARGKSNLQLGAISRHWSSAFAGNRA